MTTETVLTEKQLEDIWHSFKDAQVSNNSAMELFRTIEQTVLQSPEVQRLREDAANKTLINRLLSHGVRVLPFERSTIMAGHLRYRIPDSVLVMLSKDDLTKYIRGLYLSAQESAGDWTRGHKLLEGLGFKKIERAEGHRVFISLAWGDAAMEKQP